MSIIEHGTFAPGLGFEEAGADLAPVEPHRGRMSQWLGGICLVFAVAALFGLAGFHARIAEDQNHLDEIEQSLVDARVENDRLKLAVAQLESPARIVEMAKGQLGMIEPEHIVYLTPPSTELTSAQVSDAFKGRTNTDDIPDSRTAP